MAYNLQAFKANGVPLGGARPALFDVTITFPTVVGAGTATQKFTFQCQGAELPASDIGQVAVSYFGRKIQLNGDRNYPNWRVTLINDEDFSVRAALEDWHQAINSITDNVMDPSVLNISSSSSIGTSYKTLAVINQYTKAGMGGSGNNNDGDVIRSYQMEGIFPVNIGAIRVGWDHPNEIETYTVEFAYDWWVPVDSASTTLTTDSGIIIS